MTLRDREILGVLTSKIRVVSISQVGRLWFSGTANPARNAARRIAELAAAGWLRQLTVRVRPTPDLSRPIVVWGAGDPAPSFGSLATILANRWNNPLVATLITHASRAAVVRLGGGSMHPPRRSEVSHDLAVAEVYFHYLRAAPKSLWLSESRLLELGFGDRARLPDAMVETNGVRTAIEVGGVYTARKLAAFHEFCRSSGLRYELW